MRAIAAGHETPVLDLPGVRMLGCRLPAIEGGAVHDRDETFLRISGGGGEGRCEGQHGGEEGAFHGGNRKCAACAATAMRNRSPARERRDLMTEIRVPP